MKSMTKNHVPDTVISAMTHRAFHEKPIKIEELQDGYFNAVYQITLPDKTVILKVAPNDSVKVLRYEKNLIATEVAAMEKISRFKFIPIPHILFYDESRKLTDSAYLFMEYMPGVPLSAVFNDLSVEKRSELFTQVGIYTRKINSITSGFFGSLSLPEKRYDCWSLALFSMVDDLLRDAEEVHLSLPLSPDRIRRRIKSEAALLDNVKKPALVHKDLWIGNILVDPETVEVTGIIDCERAVFGDTLLEPACGMLDDESFVSSFLCGHRFDAEQLLRMAIYRVYLSLIMLIETPYRQYANDDVERFARTYLERGLREYKDLRGESF
jgi:aminoglycoside phosphotransferase (APT) family kinase protein